MSRVQLNHGLWIGPGDDSGLEEAGSRELSELARVFGSVFPRLTRCSWVAHFGVHQSWQLGSSEANDPPVSEPLSRRFELVKGPELVRHGSRLQDDFLLLFGTESASLREDARALFEQNRGSTSAIWVWLWSSFEMCLYAEEGCWSLFAVDSKVLDELRDAHQGTRRLVDLRAEDVFDLP